MDFDVFVARWTDGDRRLALIGELDQFAVPVLEAALAGRALAAELILDLTGLTFIDAGALGALVGLQRDLQADGVHLVLTGAGNSIHRVLSMTGLDGMFDLAEVRPPTPTPTA